ncbi:NAD-dependent epimerase/dehydratase family protein [Limimaricola cinnabarinus]|jgi:nucleoside-diphosphate-sugar epimerase|uniref:NAD-dependent dehydratase n=1 Tax=Limimaricola cinnabarinus TaxID=1125964 RepID=A0A2G1ME90_9RHOB|nr:NAD(P)-dependent oxidoreductase [Limimaricola cinnabarinus]PHP27007.1 NAD-dependent dehydratase [Limimaricola cinnabarinus]
MRLALTGASGLVGRFLLTGLAARGHEVVALGRRSVEGHEHRPWALGQAAPLAGCEALVHAAFSHAPGRYRGGEGDDPEGFLARNCDGSLRLFEEARRAGLSRAVFLSSRAVYGDYPPGTVLAETLPPRPDTLYGEMKWQVEQGLSALARSGFATASLRATGIYGPGEGHKWEGLFGAFLAGEEIEPRVATELHGDDLAAAVALLLEAPEAALALRSFNASDIILDRRDLLARIARITGQSPALPARADAARVSAMRCDRLRGLGWRPRGEEGLDAALRAML